MITAAMAGFGVVVLAPKIGRTVLQIGALVLGNCLSMLLYEQPLILYKDVGLLASDRRRPP